MNKPHHTDSVHDFPPPRANIRHALTLLAKSFGVETNKVLRIEKIYDVFVVYEVLPTGVRTYCTLPRDLVWGMARLGAEA